MNAPLLRSRFKNVYLGIASIWLTSSLLLSLVTNALVVPKILQSRIQDLESLASSQRDALIYNDNRAIRDELLREGVISRDQDFNELRPASRADRKLLSNSLRSCAWKSPTVCVTDTETVLLSEPNQQSPTFALILNTSHYSTIPGVTLYKVLGALVLLALFSFSAWAIRQQEKFLLGKIDLLASSLAKIEAAFSPKESIHGNSARDEFASISTGIQRAGLLLERKTQEIEHYKKEFERKTRLEQLAQTIAYTSHNLKAPLLEGAEFMRDLPDFMETMPKESLLRSLKSLENRLRSGAASLQAAIQSTKESELRPEPLRVDHVLSQFHRDVESHSQFSDLALDIDAGGTGAATIFFSHHEIQSALWNLTFNSVEAKRNGRISITAKADAATATLLYRDNGPGIPEPLLDRVFDDFFTTKPRGTGLGLPGVRRAIERGRGTIRALPSRDGALFEIKIPLMSSTDGAAHA